MNTNIHTPMQMTKMKFLNDCGKKYVTLKDNLEGNILQKSKI